MPNIFSIITAPLSPLLTHNDVFHFTYIEQIVPDESQAYRTLQNCQSSVQNLLPVTFLIPQIWRWLLILAMASMIQSHSTCLTTYSQDWWQNTKMWLGVIIFLDPVFNYLY